MIMKKLWEAREHGFKSVILERWVKNDQKPTERQFKFLLRRLSIWELEEK